MWTDERVARLRKLWSEGVSASKCAAELGLDHCKDGGRSAVCGKVRRLNLQRRPPSGPPRSRKCMRQRQARSIDWKPRPKIVHVSLAQPKQIIAPAPIAPDDPATLVAAAILAQARRAEARRESMRGMYA